MELVRNCFGWEHFHLYLSGAIDADRFGGKAWREEWTEKLIGIGFEPNQIFNPCKKPLPEDAPFNLDDEAQIIKKHRDNHAWKDLCDVLSQIAHTDLRLVDKCDIVLVNMPTIKTNRNWDKREIDECIDKLCLTNLFDPVLEEKVIAILRDAANLATVAGGMRVPTYGTIHEIVVARQQRKPVYMVWEGGKETCSGWLMWLVGHNNVFSTVDELITRLDNIAKGKASYNAKDWLLLDLDHDGVV